MAWGLAVVEGLSMIPTYAPGERLLVRYGGTYTIDDVVLVQRPDQIDIKRLNKVVEGRFYVIGDNLEVSTDSRHYGPIAPEQIIAKVVWRLPRFLRRH
jgi:phage repressor protein C with HTH and peptisase S24 domain